MPIKLIWVNGRQKMFKKFLHDETAIIGLKSLGLSKPKTVNVMQNKQVQSTTINNRQKQQAENLFVATTPVAVESNIHLNFKPQTKTLEGLFGREAKFNTK